MPYLVEYSWVSGMKNLMIKLFDCFAVLAVAASTAAAGIAHADKAPFTYGTGNLMVVVERDNKSIGK